MTTREKVDALTIEMADESERVMALNPSVSSEDVIRAVVERRGLSFNAWFCVCCEIGERRQAARTAEPTPVLWAQDRGCE